VGVAGLLNLLAVLDAISRCQGWRTGEKAD
jgi:hypothetical protein